MRATSCLALCVLLSACAHTPLPRASERIPTQGSVINAGQKRWGAAFQQVPSFVVTTGSLALVPYSSFRAGNIEVNVYGDNDDPACIEVGSYDSSEASRAEAQAFLDSLLVDPVDRAATRRLDPNGSLLELNGLVLESTPPTAPDAFGAAWLSIYSPPMIATQRPSSSALEQIATPVQNSDWQANDYSKSARYSPAAPGRVYVKAYHRKDGTYVRSHTRRK